MQIKSISIKRADWGPNKGQFEASISLSGGQSYPADINISIPDELLEPIVGIITQAAVESMSRSAEEFREAAALALNPPVETKAITTDAAA